jgi:hypothetical protein
MRTSDIQSSGRLPEIFVIGFTAQTPLPDQKDCKRWIGDFLSSEKAIEGRHLCAVASMSTEADLLFAEICIDLKIPLRLLLPAPEQYLRDDFDKALSSRLENVIRCALSAESVVDSEAHEKRHLECALEMVTQCQELVVLANGRSEDENTPTGEISEFASTTRKPVTIIHRESETACPVNSKGARNEEDNSELKFLNELPLLEKARALAGANVGPEIIWLTKLDANATAVAPQVRRLTAIPIIFTATAAFISGAVSHMHARAGLVAAAGVLGLVASFLSRLLKLGKKEALWVRIRTAAEISRSVLALWDMPANYRIVGSEIFPEFGGMLRSLNFIKSMGPKDPLDVSVFKERYLEERLLDQRKYFATQSSISATKGKRYRWAARVFSTIAIFLSLWVSLSPFFMKGKAVNSGLWLPLAMSGLFQLATISGAILVINDCDRRQKRYQALDDQLASLELELRAFRTWTPVIRVVTKIERILLVELLEWRSLLQNKKMPRK